MEGKTILLVNTKFNSPSMAASITSGNTENGWAYWQGLSNIR